MQFYYFFIKFQIGLLMTKDALKMEIPGNEAYVQV
jgi:hypothetical protein